MDGFLSTSKNEEKVKKFKKYNNIKNIQNVLVKIRVKIL